MSVNVHLLRPVKTLTPSDASEVLRPSRRRLRWWIVLALGVVGISVLGARRAGLIGAPTVTVVVHQVALGLVEETLTNSKAGTVRAEHRAALSPELAGRVVKIPVVEGQRVGRGDVLLRLSDEEAVANVRLQRRAREAAEADARQACAMADRAGREYARISQLAAAELVSVAAVDQAATDRAAFAAACEAARAHVAHAAAAVTAADVVVRRTVLRAPFEGIVAAVHTEVGEWITPAPPGIHLPPAVEIIGPGALSVRAPLDEVDVARVQVGLPVRVVFDALPGRTLRGKVTRVAPYVLEQQEEGRTVDVDVTLDAPLADVGVLAGTSADVEVIVRSRDGVLRVPTNAIVDDRAVLVVEGDRLIERDLRFGLRNWAFAEVTGGLAPGALIVVSLDRPRVRAGARVRMEPERVR
ncbi:Multidrug resistance protein MdtN [Luteitalea pratensis]|uniref:Multidrug resistance protein MdtN n=1 Tax=Luteitalea pratensis TaxID=1855912 RepID=A0A143PRJ9_LUTPR|nr:Multidrug resistance protein MdtN [Luteitalea pratensis]